MFFTFSRFSRKYIKGFEIILFQLISALYWMLSITACLFYFSSTLCYFETRVEIRLERTDCILTELKFNCVTHMWMCCCTGLNSCGLWYAASTNRRLVINSFCVIIVKFELVEEKWTFEIFFQFVFCPLSNYVQLIPIFYIKRVSLSEFFNTYRITTSGNKIKKKKQC
jgi:hypothetical protein